MQLTDEQKKIIRFKADSIVVSNPGTGKTTTLALRVIHLLEDGVDPDDIICITFTNKAKKEMYDAINMLSNDDFSDHVKKVHIHTFHSFAYKRLLDSGRIGEMVIDENRTRYAVYRIFKDNNMFNYGKEYIINTIVPAATGAIQYIKSFGVMPDMINITKASARLEQDHKDYIKKSKYTMAEMQTFLKYFVITYTDYEKSKQDAIDYTDILIKFLEGLEGPLFKHALIDEMQDMNKMEADIAGRVAETVFFVGDEKQAIFGFQGGSTKYLNDFKKRCKKLLLSANRRSTNQILDYAKQYYLDRTDLDEATKKDLEGFRSEKSGEIPLVITTESPYSNVLRLIRENPGKRIGILTRTNYQIMEISDILKAENIHHKTTASRTTTDRAKKHIITFLEGMLYDDVTHKIKASLTVLSPYPLAEALALAEALDADKRGKERSVPGLEELKKWGCGMTAGELDKLFDNIILPICMAHGPEWFFTAITIKQNVDQYLGLGGDAPTRERLFEYLAVGADSEFGAEKAGSDDGRTGADENVSVMGYDITISTVHKAKGQEYDVVIYLPKDTSSSPTKFIDVVKTAIMQSSGINVSGELEREESNFHFVAFTRAREKLAIITRNKVDFNIKGLCRMVEDESAGDDEEAIISTTTDMERESEQARYREAYAAFVAGRLEESMRQIGQDGWIEKQIVDYFRGLERISPTKTKSKPSEFLKEIFKIPRIETNKSLRFGDMFHRAIRDVLDGKRDVEDAVKYYCNDERDAFKKMKKSIQNALDAIDEFGSEFQNLKVHALEKHVEVSIGDMTDYDVDDMTFSGYIDAIFKHDSGYLVIDYKTDKTTSDAPKHHKQLAAYKKMLSLTEDIPEDKIDIRIIFVSITGNINTGRNDYDAPKTRQNPYPRFENDLQKVLEWKQDTNKFIDDLLKEDADMDSPYDVIVESLKRSRAVLTKY